MSIELIICILFSGQRNDRRKRIQLVVRIVADFNHDWCVLLHGETINPTQESLQWFEEIVNAKWFSLQSHDKPIKNPTKLY